MKNLLKTIFLIWIFGGALMLIWTPLPDQYAIKIIFTWFIGIVALGGLQSREK